MLEKELSLAEMMLYLYNSYVHPDEQIWKDQINNFRGQMKIRSYCPSWEKQAALLNLITQLKSEDYRPDEMAIQVEVLFTMSYIQLYTNIYVNEEITIEEFTPEILDSFNISPIYDDIWEIAQDDIERFRTMVDNTLNWSHLFEVVRTVGSFDGKKIDSLIGEIKEVKEGLSDEKLDILKELSTVTSRGDFSQYLDAAIVKSLEKVDMADIEKWREQQDVFSNLDTILTENTKKEIFDSIEQYFKEHEELNMIADTQEIQDVYEYLIKKNEEAINKIDVAIAEENRQSIQQGITSQMIKLLSKKNALKNRYKKEEELIRLADTVMSMDNGSIDEMKGILEKFQNKQ